MTAADQTEVGSGVDETAAESHGGGRTTGVHHVVGIIVGVAFLGGLTGGDDTQLSMDDQLHILGQIVGDQGSRPMPRLTTSPFFSLWRSAWR